MERLGKAERQSGLGTWISSHRAAQLPTIAAELRSARLFARVNPLSGSSKAEVEGLLALGVDVLMLPMFETVGELARFVQLVAGRARVVPLLETRGAAESIEELVRLEGIEEVHIGINDLALSLGTRHRFEVLSLPLVSRVAQTVTAAGLRLGIGALGNLAPANLPVSPDLLYARYVGLGAGASLLARSFLHGVRSPEEFVTAIGTARQRIAWWQAAEPEAHELAHRRLRAAVAATAIW
ncbi:MAG: hypothetical protein JOZ73_03130 [Solirubrobacterales bacterium]|nr:hypothetical protein [Solirubrobacterales bacterium]